jgi:hypothetical protein
MSRDLFEQTATFRNSAFANLWECLPTGAKSGKREAQKAFAKLRPAEQRAASEYVAAYYGWWRSANPQASWLHPSTYINQRRWEDEAWKPKNEAAPSADRLKFWADSITSGRYVSPATCGPALCRELVASGLVTERQVLERGLTL